MLDDKLSIFHICMLWQFIFDIRNISFIPVIDIPELHTFETPQIPLHFRAQVQSKVLIFWKISYYPSSIWYFKGVYSDLTFVFNVHFSDRVWYCFHSSFLKRADLLQGVILTLFIYVFFKFGSYMPEIFRSIVDLKSKNIFIYSKFTFLI